MCILLLYKMHIILILHVLKSNKNKTIIIPITNLSQFQRNNKVDKNKKIL